MIIWIVAFLPNIKYFRYKIGMQNNSTPLVVEQNNNTAKTVNANIVYGLDNWPTILLKNFTLKDCFFGATNIAKNSDKSKWVYSGYRITFDGKGERNFDKWLYSQYCHFWSG